MRATTVTSWQSQMELSYPPMNYWKMVRNWKFRQPRIQEKKRGASVGICCETGGYAPPFSLFLASGTLSWAFLEQTPRKPFRKCPVCPIGP